MSMETWRLSRIEEELDKLDFAVPDPADFPSPDSGSYQDFNGNQEDDSDDELPPPPPPLSYNIYYKTETPLQEEEEDIYSKVVIRPAYKSPTAEERSKQALNFITEKYDSLGKVKPSLSVSVSAAAAAAAAASVPPPPPPHNANLSLNLLRTPPAAHATTTTTASNGGTASGYAGVGYPDQQYKHQPFTTTKAAEAADVPRYPYQPHREGFINTNMDNNRSGPTPASSAHYPPAMSTNLSTFASNGDATPLHTSTGCPSLTDQDVVQVEMFFKGHKTEVFVCQSMANLYFGALNGSPSKGGPGARPEKWTYVKFGIPVLVLDSGESRRQRRLSLILAERGTGFILWKDSMNHLSEYKAQHGTFHTMHFSSDHTRVAGFSFDDAAAAAEFVHKITTLTSDPDDHMMLLSGKKKKKESRFKFKNLKAKYKAPNKADISTPCCFTHITKLDRTDGMSILGSGNTANEETNSTRDLQAPRTSLRLNSTIATRT